MNLSLKRAICILGIVSTTTSHAAPFWRRAKDIRPKVNCAEILRESDIKSNAQAMEILDRGLSEFYTPEQLADMSWYRVFKTLIRPAQNESSLMLTAISAGGNAGKSTLENSIGAFYERDPQLGIGHEVTMADEEFGVTKQSTVLVGEPVDGATGGNMHAANMNDLHSRLPHLTEFENLGQAQVPGDGVLVHSPHIPSHMGFIDTPDYDTSEENFKTAERVIQASDYVFLLVSPETIGHEANRKILRNTFARSGKKHIAFFVKNYPNADKYKTKRMLVGVANFIFNTTGEEYPDAVQGAYFMVPDADVVAKKKHPDIVPTLLRGEQNSPEFSDLLVSMAENSEQHKSYALREATKMMQESLDLDLGARVKSLYAAQLVRQLMVPLRETVARDSIVKFPFTEYRTVINENIRRLDEDGSTWIERSADWFGNIPRIFKMVVNVFAGRKSQVADADMHDRARLQAQMVFHKYLGTFTSRNAMIYNDESAKQIVASFEQFYAQFPEERDDQPCEATANHVCVRLPKLDLLPQDVRNQLNLMLQAPLESWSEALEERLYVAQKASTTLLMHQKQMLEPRTAKEKKADQIAATMFFVGPLAVGGYGYEQMHWGYWSAAAVLGVGKVIHMAWDRMRDKRMLGPLNDKLVAKQRESIDDYLARQVTPPLEESLRKIDPKKKQALRDIERVMSYLDHNYKPLSTDLESADLRPAPTNN